MSANGEEINRREVAWRLFASEFRDADFSYAESDEERAPNYVVTPTGARVNRLFVVGVLTEVEYVSDDYLRARIVDPTGAFVVYAGQYQPEALTFLENAETPTFVAVTGKARTFQPDDSDVVYTSIRPEAISEVEAATRDNWVVTTAEQTLERIATMADALDLVERGDDLRAVLEARHVPQSLAAGIPLAIDHYGTTEHYLAAVRDVALDAARVVSGDREEVEQYRIQPNETTDEPVDLGLDDYTLVVGDAQPVSASEPATEEAETASVAESGPTTSADAEDSAVTEDSEEAEVVETATVGASGSSGSSTTEPDEQSTENESDAESETVDESGAEADTGAAVEEGSEEDVEPDAEADAADTDEMYELSEEERQEVEENYDVEFSTADEVESPADEEPDEAEFESADAEPAAEDTDESTESAAEDAASTADTEETAEDLAFETETDEETEETAAEFEEAHEDDEDADLDEEESEGTTTENLEDAVVETMQELGDGAGADRDELVQTVMEDYGVDQDAVEDAIQDALMSGRCYESGDDELTAI